MKHENRMRIRILLAVTVLVGGGNVCLASYTPPCDDVYCLKIQR